MKCKEITDGKFGFDDSDEEVYGWCDETIRVWKCIKK